MRNWLRPIYVMALFIPAVLPAGTWRQLPNIVRWSPNGKLVAVSSGDHVHLFDAQKWQLVRTLTVGPPTTYGSVSSLAFAPDSQTLAVATTKTVQLWAVANGAIRRTLQTTGSVAYAPDGRTLGVLRGSVPNPKSNAVQLWRTRDGALLRTIPRSVAHNPGEIVFTPDGQTVAVGSFGKIFSTVEMWRTTDGKLRRRLEGIDGYVNSMAFTPDGQTLVTGVGGSSILLIPVATGSSETTFPAMGLAVLAPHGRTLAVGSGRNDESIELWDLSTQTRLRTIEVGTIPIRDLAWAPNGQQFVTASDTVRVWRASDGKLIKMLVEPKKPR